MCCRLTQHTHISQCFAAFSANFSVLNHAQYRSFAYMMLRFFFLTLTIDSLFLLTWSFPSVSFRFYIIRFSCATICTLNYRSVRVVLCLPILRPRSVHIMCTGNASLEISTIKLTLKPIRYHKHIHRHSECNERKKYDRNSHRMNLVDSGTMWTLLPCWLSKILKIYIFIHVFSTRKWKTFFFSSSLYCAFCIFRYHEWSCWICIVAIGKNAKTIWYVCLLSVQNLQRQMCGGLNKTARKKRACTSSKNKAIAQIVVLLFKDKIANNK